MVVCKVVCIVVIDGVRSYVKSYVKLYVIRRVAGEAVKPFSKSYVLSKDHT